MNGSLQKMMVVAAGLLCIAGCGNKPYTSIKKQRQEKLTTQVAQESTNKIASPAKNIKNMTLQEALEAKRYYEQQDNDDMLLKLIPHMISLSTDAQLTALLSLELADIHVGAGNLEAALKAYAAFITAYPGHADIKGARYRQILTSWWSALEPDRDQSATRATQHFAATYIKDYPQEDEALLKVEEILLLCYRRLLEHELATAAFYINRYHQAGKDSALDAAEARLEYANKELLQAIKVYDADLAALSRTIETTLATLKEQRETVSAAERAEQLAAIFSSVKPLQPAAHARDRF